MKILHVIPSLSCLRGGPTFVVNTLARHQARAGAEVHIATTDDDDRGRQTVPLATPISRDGAIYWYFPRNTHAYTSSIGLTSWLLKRTADFDLVHIHSVFTYPATIAAAIAGRRSIPYVVRPLGVLNRWGLQNGRAWAKRLSLRLIESRILRRAAAVQFGSLAERDETRAVLTVAKAVVIPNPVAIDAPARSGLFRARWSVPGNRRLILFLARLDPVKGIESLLDAFGIVLCSNPQALLVIAGSGDDGYVRTLRAHAERLGIANDVLWTGFLDKSAKGEALADADVFVAPSQSESFGLSAVEAMAAGVPTVVSDGVGIAQEVASHHAGIVVRPQAVEIAEALRRILGDRQLAADLSSRGRAFVNSCYQPEAVAAQTLELYTRIGARS